MRRPRKKPRPTPRAPRTRVNEMIRISPVRLIDEEGEQVGVIETPQALEMAQKKGLDLVEVAPKAQPPVCKIIDWGKYQYQEAKKQQTAKSKQKKNETKGIRLRPNTDVGDLDFKRKQAEKFLSKGHRIKAEIILRGREKAPMFAKQAREKLQQFVDKIEVPIKIEQPVQKQFNGFNVVVAPESETQA